MVRLKLFIVAASFMWVASCQFVESAASIETPTSIQECLAVAGKWVKPPLSVLSDQVVEYCVLPTSDAGTVCQSSDQCESVCVSETITKEGAEAVGRCFEWSDTIGHCLAVIENGISTGEVCFD